MNEQMSHIVNRVLADYLAHHRTDGAYLWSKENDGKIKVGATFRTYEYNGELIAA